MSRGSPSPGSPARLLSRFALAAYAAAALAPLAAILLLEPRGGSFASALEILSRPRSLRAVGFTLAQAAASTVAALAIGLPGAALVARYRFPGRKALKALSVLPFCLPSILVVLSFVLFYGRSGYLNRLLMAAAGLEEPPLTFLYGFWGIVLVHGFYEFPVVLQTVGEVWERLPRDRERAARLLGAGRFRAFAAGTLPSLAPAIAQAASLCFLLCFFSFAVVMVFGGLAGSTLEVEVYRLSRFEADPSAASALALAETVIAIVAVSATALFERASSRGIASARAAGSSPELARPRGAALAALAAYGVFLAVFLGGPLLSLAIQAFSERGGPFGPASAGLGNFRRLFAGAGAAFSRAGGPSFARAAGGTLMTAIPAAAIAALLGCAGAFGLRRGGAAAGAVATLPLAVSGIVASLGWSLLLPAGGPFLISIVQALGAMPYVLRPVAAALATLEAGPVRAARSLGATRLRAALEVELPAVGPTVLAAAAFAFAVSAGDMTAPLALARGSFETIPVYLYRLTSSYRFPEACAAGLVLSLVGVSAFAVGRGGSDGRRRGDA